MSKITLGNRSKCARTPNTFASLKLLGQLEATLSFRQNVNFDRKFGQVAPNMTFDKRDVPNVNYFDGHDDCYFGLLHHYSLKDSAHARDGVSLINLSHHNMGVGPK